MVPSNTGKQAASSKTHDIPGSDKEVSDSESSESDGDFIAIMDDADDGERESNRQLSQQSVVFKRKIDTGAAAHQTSGIQLQCPRNSVPARSGKGDKPKL